MLPVNYFMALTIRQTLEITSHYHSTSRLSCSVLRFKTRQLIAHVWPHPLTFLDTSVSFLTSLRSSGPIGVLQQGNRIPACIKSPSSRHTQPLPVPPPASSLTKPLPPPQGSTSNSSLLPVPLTSPTSNTSNQQKLLQTAQSYRWVTLKSTK